MIERDDSLPRKRNQCAEALCELFGDTGFFSYESDEDVRVLWEGAVALTVVGRSLGHADDILGEGMGNLNAKFSDNARSRGARRSWTTRS